MSEQVVIWMTLTLSWPVYLSGDVSQQVDKVYSKSNPMSLYVLQYSPGLTGKESMDCCSQLKSENNSVQVKSVSFLTRGIEEWGP